MLFRSTVAASLQTPTLFSIARDLTRMQIEASVDEADIGRIAEGQKAICRFDAWPDTTFEGTVTQVRLKSTVVSNVVTYTGRRNRGAPRPSHAQRDSTAPAALRYAQGPSHEKS